MERRVRLGLHDVVDVRCEDGAARPSIDELGDPLQRLLERDGVDVQLSDTDRPPLIRRLAYRPKYLPIGERELAGHARRAARHFDGHRVPRGSVGLLCIAVGGRASQSPVSRREVDSTARRTQRRAALSSRPTRYGGTRLDGRTAVHGDRRRRCRGRANRRPHVPLARFAARQVGCPPLPADIGARPRSRGDGSPHGKRQDPHADSNEALVSDPVQRRSGPRAGGQRERGLSRSTTRIRVIKPPALQEVDGGAAYYGRFSNALPTNRIPMSVWFESVITQADIRLDKDVGINTYVVLTATSNLGLVRSNGTKALIQASQRSQFSPQPGAETAGWELADEIDMQRPPAAGCAELKSIRDSLPADGRLRYNGFGKGVMFWETAPRPPAT